VRRPRQQHGPSEALRNLGRELEREYGIEPLRAGERRPDGYYLTNHFTGRSLYPAGTVEVDGKIILPPRRPRKMAWPLRIAAFLRFR